MNILHDNWLEYALPCLASPGAKSSVNFEAELHDGELPLRPIGEIQTAPAEPAMSKGPQRRPAG
jgi:hypothetical protein